MTGTSDGTTTGGPAGCGPASGGPAKSCGPCALCCKVYAVPPLAKPKGRWCAHCAPGHGCAIHATRPEFCRDFHCYWLLDPALGPEWRPDAARFVMNLEDGGRRLSVALDPGAPAAWRRAPFEAALRRLAGEFLAAGRCVVIYGAATKWLLLPEAEPVALGRPEEQRGFGAERGPDGRWRVTLAAAA